MSKVKHQLLTPLCFVFGNKAGQMLLGCFTQLAQYLMGIGPEKGVNDSGEAKIFDALTAQYRGPYVVFDVGANKGSFLSLAQRQLAGKKAEIHCFEPGREAFRLLKVHAANSGKVFFNNFALGEGTADGMLYYDVAGSGLGSLTRRNLDHIGIEFTGTESITVRTVDEYCLEQGIENITLLKIDVEGHEMSVLKGAEQMFAKKAVSAVSFEFGGCNIDTRTFFKDFWNFFRINEFDIHRITSPGYFFPLAKYEEIYEQFRTTNFVAFKKK